MMRTILIIISHVIEAAHLADAWILKISQKNRLVRGLYHWYYKFGGRRIVRFTDYLRASVNKKLGRDVVRILHIRKTGGTAVLNALKSTLRTDKYVVFFSRGHSLKLSHVSEGEKCVAFLRDPVSRFVSLFNDRLRQGLPAYYYPWTKVERLAFRSFPTPNDLAEALSSTDPPRKMSARLAMADISSLRSSQLEWFGDLDYLEQNLDKVLFIGFQETLDADFQILKDLLGIPPEICLPRDEKTAHKSSSEAKYKYLSDEAKANIRDWYQSGYELIQFVRKKHSPYCNVATLHFPEGISQDRKGHGLKPNVNRSRAA